MGVASLAAALSWIAVVVAGAATTNKWGAHNVVAVVTRRSEALANHGARPAAGAGGAFCGVSSTAPPFRKWSGRTFSRPSGTKLSFFGPQRSRPRHTILWAAAKKKTKNGKSKTTGMGFGGGEDAQGGTPKKVRTISGNHVGAGTKALRAATNAYDAIVAQHQDDHDVTEYLNDVYIRSPRNDESLFWFVGKVARRLDTTPRDAILSQKRLILEYAKSQLRPQNFAGSYAPHLELWMAPGNSEMAVVQNKITLEKVEGSTADLSDDFSIDHVGYNPEIYVGDEIGNGGLRVRRNPENGQPLKPAFDVSESI